MTHVHQYDTLIHVGLCQEPLCGQKAYGNRTDMLIPFEKRKHQKELIFLLLVEYLFDQLFQ